MKVIFQQDVPKVAKAGDVKEVADGYGKNFLIPRKLARLATPQVIRDIEAQLKKEAHAQAKTEAELQEMADQINGREVVFEVRTGSEERLYGAITAADIAAELEKISGFVIDKRKIELDEPIHQVGSWELTIKLAKDIVPKIKVTVIGKIA